LLVGIFIVLGFLGIGTLHPEFTVKIFDKDLSTKHLNFIWMFFTLILLYYASAVSELIWIFGLSSFFLGIHGALHNVNLKKFKFSVL
jgi:hypothetical protein